MTRAVIIEDDPLQMLIISDLISDSFPQIEIVGKGGLSSEGVMMIRSLKPDLVFLDLDLPDKTGFEMLNELQEIHFDVIFVTAHEKYALEAHQYDSLGYLIKPVTKQKLTASLKRIKEQGIQKDLGTQFQHLLQSVRNSVELPQKIAVPTLKEIHYIHIQDIIRFEADGNYTTLFQMNGQTITASRQIGEYETKLVGQGFFRVHDKHLINLRLVKSFIKGESGNAVMEDNSHIPVSRRKKEEFLRSLEARFS